MATSELPVFPESTFLAAEATRRGVGCVDRAPPLCFPEHMLLEEASNPPCLKGLRIFPFS